jgi:SAM-dependent methyltransferase
MDLRGTMTRVRSDKHGHVFDIHYARSGEQHRCITAAFGPMTTARLAETGVTDGWECLDVGFGSGSVACWLADRVAPTGGVLATDVKPIRFPDHPNLTVVQHDIRSDSLQESRFDLIVVRLLLQHFSERDAVLAKLVRALKPGGWLQIEEFDTSYEPVLLAANDWAAEPYEKFLSAKKALMRSAGGDPEWGRHTARAMRAAGLVDIDPRPHVRTREWDSADLRLQINHTYHLRDGLVSVGMTEEELPEVRAVMCDPWFRAALSLTYSVQGRKERQE